MARAEAPFERFQRSYEIDAVTACWNWTGFTEGNRYGVIRVFDKMESAHRFSYELYNGAIPAGLEILHSCDNRQCVNPDHLAVGTHEQNMLDAVLRGRMRSGVPPLAEPDRPSPKRGIKCHQSHPVIVLGKPYGSKNRAEVELGLGRGTVAYWLRSGHDKARQITRDEYLALTERVA